VLSFQKQLTRCTGTTGGAEKCYAYLTDVVDENSGDVRDDLSDINSIDVVYDFQEPSVELPRSIRPGRGIFQFLNSRWFKRGWTLQDLLAPATLEFYDQEWNMIGTKFSLATFIQIATEIQAQYISDRNAMKRASIGI